MLMRNQKALRGYEVKLELVDDRQLKAPLA